MRNIPIVMLACSLLLSISTTSSAEEQGGSALSIIKRLEPEPAKKKPAPDIPIYSTKSELLQDIKDGKGLFFSVRGLSKSREFDYPSEASEKIKAMNIAFAKSIKTIIESQSKTPVIASLDSYQSQDDCGFAENLVFVTESLREYTLAVKLKSPPFQLSKYVADELNRNLKNKGTWFERHLNQFKACVTKAGNSFDPIDSIIVEMAEAISVRAEILKAKKREQFGRQLSESFLSSRVIDQTGEESDDVLTNVEGLLEDLLSKTTFKKWTVQGDIYKLEAIYNKDRLSIEMTHSPQSDSTTLEGTLRKDKINAHKILNLPKFILVN